MRRTARWMSALAVLALVLAPALAEARAGGNSSSGSRGSRTYSAPPATQTAPATARPLERTATQPGQAQAAPAAARPGVPAAAGGASRFGTGFMGGMMGGLLGVGLIGLLTGAGLFGGFAGFASLLGFLLQIALIGGLVFLVVRLFRASRPQTAPAVPPQAMAREMHAARGQMAGAPMAGGAAVTTQPLRVGPADFDAFGQRLVAVQDAWTRGDRDAMARLATPEMLAYFEQDWSDLAARGWRNEVRDVALEQGDLSEGWREGSRDYATVAMRFSMIDVTRRLADGAVVEGEAEARQTATEIWTFVRVGPAGDWMLSAIQQTG
jgi:predicted lipid-binding transport protein (Tim44 family)